MDLFFELFADKDECYLAALDALAERAPAPGRGSRAAG